jgi:hypothetical protein
MMHFTHCHTAAECKAEYKRLAKELHPDKQGGSSAAFQQMQAEYEARLLELQKNARFGSKEYTEIAKAMLDVLHITKPEYYQMAQAAVAAPLVAGIAGALGGLFPDKKETIDGILSLLK